MSQDEYLAPNKIGSFYKEPHLHVYTVKLRIKFKGFLYLRNQDSYVSKGGPLGGGALASLNNLGMGATW